MYQITKSMENKDFKNSMNIFESKDYYMNLYGNFKSKLPIPAFYPCQERNDIFILDFARGPCGLKAYGAEKLIATINSNVLSYAAPRVGHAAEAIASLCETYGKRCVFFAAASSQVTEHQAVVLAYKGCELRFAKIPAMPTLNAWIRQWANNFGATALPFGLSGVEMVTAGLINMCEEHIIMNSEPPEFFCAVSTGTMIRALQIGWPNSQAFGVAVARNIKDGEKGKAFVNSYHRDFYKKSDYIPNFETTVTYDAKAYRTFIKTAKPGAVFINVGSDRQIQNRLSCLENWQHIDSQREWGDKSAFETA